MKISKKYVFLIFLFLACITYSSYAISIVSGIRDKTPAQHALNRDFYVFYVASDLVLKGEAAAVYDSARFENELVKFRHSAVDIGHWLYPPSFLPYISWLANLKYYSAYMIWGALQLFAFLLAGYKFLFKTTREAIIFAAIPAVLLSLSWGSAGLLIGAMHIAAFRFLKTKPKLSGVLWGLAAIKPALGLVVPVMLLANRKYQVFLYALLTLIATILISLVLFGAEPWINYFSANFTSFEYYFSDVRKAHLNMPTIFAALSLLDVDNRIKYLCQLIAFVACAIIVYKMWKDDKGDYFAKIAGFYFLTFLATPYANLYDYVPLICFTLVWFMQKKEFSLAQLAILFMVYFFDNVTLRSNALGIPISPLILIFMLYYLQREEHKKFNLM